MSSWASWVLCLDDGLAHLPMMQGPGMLVTRCQRSMLDAVPHPGVVPQDQWRSPGFVALLCPLDLAPKTLAGHRLRLPVKSQDGQLVPEFAALAELLAEVAVLAEQRAMFPGRLEEIVRRALRGQR